MSDQQTLIPAKSKEDGSKRTVCLIAHNAYGVLAKEETPHVGGIEVQVPMMSKWLAARGRKTTMISWDTGYEDGIVHDGVIVRKLCRQSSGIPILRFIHPRWTSFINALSRANSDVYYYNCGDMGLGQLVLWAKIRRKKVVYSVANTVDCTQELPALKPLRERILYKYGLRNADYVICQTDVQKQLLQSEYGITAKLIRMPCDGFAKTRSTEQKLNSPKRILWAGRFTTEKRLEMFLDLASAFPSLSFDVIGDYNFDLDSEYVDMLKEKAANIANVTLHGRIPHDKMGDYFNDAYLLCSTSIYEGFPNIYLEAWSVGLPLITTFDPDNVVKTYGLGGTATDLDELSDLLVKLLDEDNWRSASSAAEKYFNEYHSIEITMHQFEKAIDTV